MKRIMLVMAQNTGSGHLSITQALKERFAEMDDIEIETVDGFSFMGAWGVAASKFYNFMCRHAVFMWKFIYTSSQGNQWMPNTIGRIISKRLDECIQEKRPDMIITVHSMFVGSIINALEKIGRKIPVVTLQADIQSIHSSWCDKRAYMTLCTSDEGYKRSLTFGMDPARMKTIGFPTRRMFTDAALTEHEHVYNPSKPPRLLLMGGGGGAGGLDDYAEEILGKTDASLTIICGTNALLCDRLKDRFGTLYGDRLTVLGYVKNIAEEFANVDITVLRASPNTMFESIVMGRPMILTGSLPGQEAENPTFALKHKLGLVCVKREDISKRINELTRDGGKRYFEMQNAMRAYRDLDIAKNIAEFVASLAREL